MFAVAASTPSIILITVSTALGQSIPGLAYIAFTLLYLLIGIKACATPTEKDIPKLKLTGLLDEAEDDPAQQIHAA